MLSYRWGRNGERVMVAANVPHETLLDVIIIWNIDLISTQNYTGDLRPSRNFDAPLLCLPLYCC